MTQSDVAALLMVEPVADPGQGLDQLSAGNHRKPGHTATSTISSEMGGGMGSWCFSKLFR